MRPARPDGIFRSKNSVPHVPTRQNGTKNTFRTCRQHFSEQKIRPARPDPTKWHEKYVPHVPTAFFGAKNAVGMDFLMKSTRNRRNSSNLWQNYDTAKVGAMVIHVLNMAGMHRWCRLLAT